MGGAGPRPEAMTANRALLYFATFVGLAVTAILAVDRIGRPSIASTLAWVAVAAALAGAPGLVWRRAWPAALLALPLGALLVLRTQMPPPPEVRGLGAQADFYAEQLRSGAVSYATHSFPMDFATAGDLKLLLVIVVYGVVGLAAFAALSLNRPVAGITVLLVPLGFGLTVDGEARALGLTLVFLLFAGGLLLTSRARRRRRWATGDTALGLGGAALAAALAVWVVAATPLAAAVPWQDWRTWDVDLPGRGALRFRLDGGIRRPPRPAERRAGHVGELAAGLVLEGERARGLRRRGLVQHRADERPARGREEGRHLHLRRARRRPRPAGRPRAADVRDP